MRWLALWPWAGPRRAERGERPLAGAGCVRCQPPAIPRRSEPGLGAMAFPPSRTGGGCPGRSWPLGVRHNPLRPSPTAPRAAVSERRRRHQPAQPSRQPNRQQRVTNQEAGGGEEDVGDQEDRDQRLSLAARPGRAPGAEPAWRLAAGASSPPPHSVRADATMPLPVLAGEMLAAGLGLPRAFLVAGVTQAATIALIGRHPTCRTAAQNRADGRLPGHPQLRQQAPPRRASRAPDWPW